MTPPRTHPLVGLAFGVGAALAILLTGPLLLFNPWFVSFEQARHDVPARLDVDRATSDRATVEMLGDILLGGDFTATIGGGGPVLDASERSHMRDVGGVVRSLLLLDAAALVAVMLSGRRLRTESARRGRLLLLAGGGIGAGAVVLGGFFAFAFDAAFAAFHAVFFPPGTWQFGPGSNLLRFFPEPFWYEAAIVAGGTVVIGALVAALFGRRDLARRPASV